MTTVDAGTSQLGLFAGTEPVIDRTFATAHRIALDETSWVEHVPGWLGGSDGLFDLLRSEAGWEQRDRWMVNRQVTEPRLTAEYPGIEQAPLLLRDIAAALSDHYGVPYDGLWLNLYRDERDSTSWHGDWPSCKRDVCTVPVLSLGAARRFLIRPREGGRSTVLTPMAGDLVVMGGRCQRDFRHMVPKQTPQAGARISVNFKSSLQATPERAVRGG
jgi:alkylated DNA repair dioxygenase AlkB